VGKLADLTRRWIRQARRLFHMLISLAFLFLASAGGFLSFTEWRNYRENPAVGMAHFGFVFGFTILLIVFSLYSFVKARSVR
jgi:hypothetical protein